MRETIALFDYRYSAKECKHNILKRAYNIYILVGTSVLLNYDYIPPYSVILGHSIYVCNTPPLFFFFAVVVIKASSIYHFVD